MSLLAHRARAPARPALTSRAGWQAIWLALAALALPVSLVLSSMFGQEYISPIAIPQILLNHWGLTHFAATWASYDFAILWYVRLPRVVEGALVGAALATAGTLFQGLLRNPLADPYLLGISSGAALGATVALLIPGAFLIAGYYGLPILAFAGALVAVAAVYSLARVGSQTPVVTLILAGVAVSTVLGATQTLIITQNVNVAHAIGGLYIWLSGGIESDTWSQIAVVALVIALGVAGALALAPTLDTFALGEEGATNLGVRVERAKLATVGVASLLVAAAVSLSGLVGFVGLFVPHICRLVVGPRHRVLVPLAALAGAIFVIWADVLARSLIPNSELPLGVVTALVGGPFFLWLLRRATL